MTTKRLLVVDDEPTLLRVVGEMLSRLGFGVKTATDGFAALEILRADPLGIDAIVTDLRMPGMSGLELATAARRLRSDLAIVLCSGFLDEGHLEQAGALDILHCLAKPYTLRELSRVLALAIDAERTGWANTPAI